MAEGYPGRVAQRRYCDPYADALFGWYGNDPVFQTLVEKNLNSIEGYDRPFRRILGSHELIYMFRVLQVPGDRESHDVRVVFRSGPLPAWTCGVARCDYPAVYTSVGRPRKHVHPDGGLCLWAPFDPPEQRWWHGDGLRPLVELTRRHLFFELHWWRTGGRRGGEWLGDEPPTASVQDRTLRDRLDQPDDHRAGRHHQLARHHRRTRHSVVVAVVPVVINIVLNAGERRVEREDRLRQAFSEALRAIADYQELPYLVRRRSDVSSVTREELSRHASEGQSRLDLYVARLELESAALGEAFGRLVSATRREVGAQMSQAWASPRITADDRVPLGVAYDRSSANEERRRCLSVMRTHVSQRMLRHES